MQKNTNHMKRKTPPQAISTRRKPKQQKMTPKEQKVFLARKLLSSTDVKTTYINIPASVATTAVPFIVALTDPTILIPGTANINQYVGSKIKPIGLTVRYTINMADTTNTVRVGIFQFDGDLGGLSASDLYHVTTNPLSPIQAYSLHEFNTLHDRIYTGSNLNNTYAWNNIQQCKVYIKGKKLFPVHFTSGGAQISSGPIVLCVLSDSNAVSHPYITAYSEMKYLDA